MGALSTYLSQRIGDLLENRKILVWYDATSEWLLWVSQLAGVPQLNETTEPVQITLRGLSLWLVPFRGSYYEIVKACDQITNEDSALVLVYVPGEKYFEHLSPIRELECMGGEREPLQLELRQLAREAFREQGLAEGKIDDLLNRDGLNYAYLDAVPVAGAEASPLTPIFGSSREIDVIPRFLSDKSCRTDVASKGLLPAIVTIAQQGLGLHLNKVDEPEELARELARVLLVAEMRSDLTGTEPLSICQVPKPSTEEQMERARQVCSRFRRSHPAEYEATADQIEKELGLAEAGIEPLALGHIDTFRFEERALLTTCDQLLFEGKPEEVLSLAKDRAQSFWTSVARHPSRQAAWSACEALAQLQSVMQRISKELPTLASQPKAWVDAYTAPEGWHHVDRLFRESRYLLTKIDTGELDQGPTKIFANYDELIDGITCGFTKHLSTANWQINGILLQTDVFPKKVKVQNSPTAYLLVDAMRFEMGMKLAELMRGAGADDVRVDPAVAMAPTITDVGMVALLPDADRSFSVTEGKRSIVGCIDGQLIEGSQARMDHAKSRIPGLMEMTMDHLLYEATTGERKQISKAPVVIIRSQEIDGSGESLDSGVARKIMGTVLEDIRKAVLKLAELGVEHFVITADHGHLFGSRKGEDMRIDPPQGGTTADLHRRCWIGCGGNTPSSCHRVPLKDLGFQTDLDLVVPKGVGVFKAQGDLAYHHGGLSLQELIIPIVSLSVKGKASKPSGGQTLVNFCKVPREISNLIFSVSMKRMDLPATPLTVRVLIVEAQSGKSVGQARFANQGWDSDQGHLSLPNNDEVSVGIEINDETATELRVLVVEVGTERVLKDTQPIPVKLLR